MTDAAVEAMAEALARGRRTGERFVTMPAPWAGDLGFAYAVQERLVARLRAAGAGEIAGWKLGFTTAKIQTLAGVPEPASGVLLAKGLWESGQALAVTDFMHLGLEGEIAVRVGEAFPETDPVDPAVAFGRLESAAAAFEVTDDRHADWSVMEGASLIADNIWNIGAVIGPPTPTGSLKTLVGLRGVVSVNGQMRDVGLSQDTGYDPAAIVAWLGAHLARRGRPLEPGQWIMTGSFVPTTFPRAGDHYQFEVDGLAPVEARVV